MKRIVPTILFAFALLFGMHAKADPASSDAVAAGQSNFWWTERDASQVKALRWLSQEPVTMMDLGILRLRDELTLTLDRLAHNGVGLERPVTSAYYNWRRREIVAYAIVSEPYNTRTLERCAQVFEQVVSNLTQRAPKGPDQASWFLEELFTHIGPRGHRPNELGHRLVEITRLEISLAATYADRRAGDHKRFQCEGPLNAELQDLKTRISGVF